MIYLQIFNFNGQFLILLDNNIFLYVILYLVVLFYVIFEVFDYVVFDFYWGYFLSGCDYLDVLCLVYKGIEFFKLVDWKNCYFSGIIYFGDVMNDYN